MCSHVLDGACFVLVAGTGLLGALLGCLVGSVGGRDKGEQQNQKVLEGGGFLHQQGYVPKSDVLSCAAGEGTTGALPGKLQIRRIQVPTSLRLSDITDEDMRHDYRNPRLSRMLDDAIGFDAE